MRIGAHVSVAKGLAGVITEAREYGCETFQLFTSSPRSRKKREYTATEIEKFTAELKADKIKKFIVHSPYYINLASPDEKVFHSSITYSLEDLKRTDMLGGKYWIVHMGSHTGSGAEVALERNIRGLEKIFAQGEFDATVLIETTAGQGTQIGSTFDEIAAVIKKFGKTEKIGVVIDTQHTFAAGYDWSTPEAAQKTLREFDEKIGLAYLKVMHLNDSATELGSRVDRHAHIGQGKIGLAGFHALLHAKELSDIDGIVETHSDHRKADIALLKKLRDTAVFDPSIYKV